MSIADNYFPGDSRGGIYFFGRKTMIAGFVPSTTPTVRRFWIPGTDRVNHGFKGALPPLHASPLMRSNARLLHKLSQQPHHIVQQACQLLHYVSGQRSPHDGLRQRQNIVHLR